jgi:hypothetical protein
VIPIRDGYVVHMYNDFLGYYFVDRTTITKAHELVKAIRKYINIYKRRWNFKVIVIYLNSQQSILDSNK